jgi:hypothetical protein
MVRDILQALQMLVVERYGQQPSCHIIGQVEISFSLRRQQIIMVYMLYPMLGPQHLNSLQHGQALNLVYGMQDSLNAQ